MKLEGLFSSLVLTDELSIDDDSIIEYCYNLKNTNTNWSSGRLPIEHLSEPPLNVLVKEIDDRVKILKSEFSIKQEINTTMTDYWANIHVPEDRQTIPSSIPHFHSGYFLSAVYYPKASQGAGNLTLMAPFNAIEQNLTYAHLDTPGYFNAPTWNIEPHKGKLVIFPSWLMHYVNPNNSKQDRISIAFNISLPSLVELRT